MIFKAHLIHRGEVGPANMAELGDEALKELGPLIKRRFADAL